MCILDQQLLFSKNDNQGELGFCEYVEKNIHVKSITWFPTYFYSSTSFSMYFHSFPPPPS